MQNTQLSFVAGFFISKFEIRNSKCPSPISDSPSSKKHSFFNPRAGLYFRAAAALRGNAFRATRRTLLSHFCHIRKGAKGEYIENSMPPIPNPHPPFGDGRWKMGVGVCGEVRKRKLASLKQSRLSAVPAPISDLRPRLRSPSLSLLRRRRSPISWAAASLLFLLPGIQAQTAAPAAPAMRVTSETGPMIDSTRETIAK